MITIKNMTDTRTLPYMQIYFSNQIITSDIESIESYYDKNGNLDPNKIVIGLRPDATSTATEVTPFKGTLTFLQRCKEFFQ